MNYPEPFITERADPFVTKGPDGLYYFTASYPAIENPENGYDRIILRCSKTVIGLRDAEEITIWKAPESGEGTRHIWAPEIHYINDNWYIFFAAGNSDNVWNIRPYIIKCTGKNPIYDKWENPVRMKACSEDKFAFTDFSLDMTHFESSGKHYLVWAQKAPDSSLFIAQINPDDPSKLISKSVRISDPEYDWEIIRYRVNEGPAALKTDEKIYIFYSASGTGSEYCVGKLTADTEANLLDADSWVKDKTPILSSADLVGAAGPGHNSFVTDENGDLLIIYHARPLSHDEKKCGTYFHDPLYDPCRHARIKKVEFRNGEPFII